MIKRIEKEIQHPVSKLYLYRNVNIENYNEKKNLNYLLQKKEATEKTSLDKKSLKIEKKKFVLKDGKKKNDEEEKEQNYKSKLEKSYKISNKKNLGTREIENESYQRLLGRKWIKKLKDIKKKMIDMRCYPLFLRKLIKLKKIMIFLMLYIIL